MKYNKGDVVKVLKNHYSGCHATPQVGEVCTISRRYGNNGIGVIRKGETYDWFMLDSEVELYKEEPVKHQYKVGDKVRVLNDTYHVGLQDNVTEVLMYEERYAHGVTLVIPGDNYRKGLFYTLSQIEPYKEEVMNTKIEVGDIISGSIKGRVYTIDRITDTLYWCTWTTPEGKVDTGYGVDKNKAKLISKANKMKEVIGYNIKPEFVAKRENILKAIYNNPTNAGASNGTLFTPNSAAEVRAKDLNVLDLWFEPVYKSSEVKVQLSNNRTATITSKNLATITLKDNTKFQAPSDAISKVLTALDELATIAGYRPEFKEFNLGCQTFTISDLQAVDQAFKDFK